ncbi:MAG TPA: Gfo/Idh/MocA family oxidoreductase [Roseiflexaceae bacterium]|nr:Gfo/Idh/MocA family oxidoreductase [Roseiflexaceae bacterium]
MTSTHAAAPLRLIQVGLGGWGQNWHANVLRPFAGVDLVGFVEPDATMREQARERLDVPPERCFGTLAEALHASDAEAVLITASLGAHIPVATAALEAGKHVLVEKPFAATVEEARGVVEAAEARGLVLMVSQNYRFYPAIRATLTLLREQVLGPVDAVTIDFRRYANINSDPATRHQALAQPLLMDMAVHHFDLMRLLLGQEPQQVSCHAWNPPWSRFVEPAAAAATIFFDGGAVVSYRGSWVSAGPPTPWAGEWQIECERGAILMTSRADTDLSAERVTLRPLKKTARQIALPELPAFDRAGALDAFVRAVRTGEPPECSGRDNLGTLWLMRAAIESANTGEARRRRPHS